MNISRTITIGKHEFQLNIWASFTHYKHEITREDVRKFLAKENIFDDDPVRVIRAIRILTGWSLKECKDWRDFYFYNEKGKGNVSK